MRVVAASAAAVDWCSWLGLFDDEAGLRVVAVPTQALRYANSLPPDFEARFPGFAKFRAEVLFGFEPDLVICDDYQNALTIEALRRAGTEVVTLEAIRGFEDLRTNLVRLGRALEASVASQRVAEAAERLEAERRALELQVAAGTESWTKWRVLPCYELGGHIASAGRGSSEALLLELAGVANVATDLGLVGHDKVRLERLLEVDVDCFLVSDEKDIEGLRRRPALAQVAAMREERFVVLDARLRQANSPFVLTAARALRAQLELLANPGTRDG